MAGMNTASDIQRERHRRATGQFGAHEHTPPDQLHATVKRTYATVVRSSMERRTETRGLFGRRRTSIDQIPIEMQLDNWADGDVMHGDNGERILSGQAYLPARRGEAHAPADEHALTALLHHSYDDAQRTGGSTAAPNSGRRAPGVIIDGMLWVLASWARDLQV